jgi:hypothetical protein
MQNLDATSGEAPVPSMGQEDVSTTSESALGHRAPNIDDIRVEHHPSANVPTEHFAYEDYTSAIPDPDPNVLPSSEREPWSAFRSRLNFELAEFMQDVRLNEGEIKRLLSIVDQVASRPSQYSIVDMKDLKDMWKSASAAHGSGVCVLFL